MNTEIKDQAKHEDARREVDHAAEQPAKVQGMKIKSRVKAGGPRGANIL